MAKVTVTPAEFHFVSYDAPTIQKLIEEVADLVGLPADAVINIDIDESTPLGRCTITSLDPISFAIEGGAFENAKAPRQLSERGVREVMSRMLFRVQDRLSGGFADAPAEGEVPLPHNTAWDVYAVGRSVRLGVQASRARRLYHFRNRHGFTDVSDAAFEQLWNTDAITWAELSALVDDVAAARASASA